MKKTKPDTNTYSFSAKVWIFNGPTPWYFITLPKKLAAEVRMFHGGLQKNFGTIRVTATLGKTSWKTSVFRDTKRDSYVLPLKAEIRKKEKIEPGRKISVRLEI